MNIDIYYDGIDIFKYSKHNLVCGFTTNISFMKEGNITNYNEFIENSLKYTKNKPISFQIYEDDDEKIEKMSKKIASYNENIFIKIPIIKTNGESNKNIIKKLHDQKININVTAIYTKNQLESIKDIFNTQTPVIISIFAGKINDTGLDCTEIVKYAKKIFEKNKNIKILWAACRTVYNIIEAEKQGADIVTVPGSVLDRIERFNKDLNEQCIECVRKFKDDSRDIILI